MISARWLEKRKPYWDRLESIVQRSGRGGLGALSHDELRELGLLYRQVAADLSSVREDPMSQRIAGYLNQLLGRAHNLIYMGRRARPGGILEFYRSVFPRIFRETFNYTLAAFAVFLGAAVAGFLICLADPAFQRFFLGPRMSDTIERREMWTHSILTIKPLASSFITTNNLTVSFTTFALGISGGLGTVYMMATNGLLAEFVAPHGVLELPAIFIAGGGGLLIARGLLFPGSLPRRDALVVYGGQGVRLALGIVPMLIVAGVIEAFLSPSFVPAPAKFVFAFAVFGLFALYVTQAGRGAGSRE
ncbi:MAG: hypothetical protein DMG26_14465 [Acidobacteria bacterium]|nr:MAG: hypothetical protein DMG26_14465 [Acidobacteriota bacterium]